MGAEVLYARERFSAELRWYFREAEGDMGLRSNYSPMVSRLQGVLGGGPLRLELDGRNVAAAGRARRVKAALELLSPVQWWTLGVAFGNAVLPVNLVGLMCTTKSADEEWRLSRTTRTLPDWVERLGRKPTTTLRQRLYAKLKHEAEALLEDALDAYSKARRR
jgi:hypothetical protein